MTKRTTELDHFLSPEAAVDSGEHSASLFLIETWVARLNSSLSFLALPAGIDRPFQWVWDLGKILKQRFD